MANNFSNGLLCVPNMDLDPFEQYPTQKDPDVSNAPRGRRGSLNRTDQPFFQSVDFDPMTDGSTDQGTDHIPRVVVDAPPSPAKHQKQNEPNVKKLEQQKESWNAIKDNQTDKTLGQNDSGDKSNNAPKVNVILNDVEIPINFISKQRGRSCFPNFVKERKSTSIQFGMNNLSKNKNSVIHYSVPSQASVEDNGFPGQKLQKGDNQKESVKQNIKMMTSNCHVSVVLPSNEEEYKQRKERRKSLSNEIQKEERRMMKQRQRLMALKEELDIMETEAKERETRLTNWQERLDAQELCLQERETMAERRQADLDKADSQLTLLCTELERCREKLRTEGRKDKVAKLNWSFLRKVMTDKQYALEAALRSYKLDILNKEARLKDNRTHIEMCQAKIFRLESELDRRSSHIVQLEHIITSAMRGQSPCSLSRCNSPSTPRIVIDDFSVDGYYSRNSRAASLYSTASAAESIQYINPGVNTTMGNGSLVNEQAPETAETMQAEQGTDQKEVKSRTCVLM